jgi:Secretion system C-terminal sorting domain
MKNLKKIILSVGLVALVQGTMFGQSPILEMDESALFLPPGPNTNPITVPFSLDLLNDNNYITPPNPISVTVSLRNQTFTNMVGYNNIFDGLTFGGGANLSSGGALQQSATEIPYRLLGAYPGNGGPKSDMFTSNPYATGAELGTGFDVDFNLFSPFLNGAVQIYTTAQVLFDSNYRSNKTVYAKDARVYYGELVFKFSQPVKNPVIHIAGLGGAYRFLPFGDIDIATNYKSTFFTSELEMVNPDLTSTLLSNNGLLTLVGNNMYNNYAKPNGDSYPTTPNPPLFFDNYGAMSGSVRINGTVTELVYKVFLKGSPLSDFAWSTKGLNPITGSQLVTGATRNPFTGDIWLVAASLLAPYQQISGNVFLDGDALINNNIATTGTTPNDGTSASGLLFANLIDEATGLVVDVTKVYSSGAYLFDSVAVNAITGTSNFHVEISKTAGTVGNIPPVADLPIGWLNTGEKNGLLVGGDIAVNSKSDPFTVNVSDVITNINFGIQRPPNSDIQSEVISTPTAYSISQNTATNPVAGLDPEDGTLGNPQTIVITALPTNATLYYNNVLVVPNFTTIVGFDPSKLSYTNITPGSLSVVFEYAFLDKATVIDPTPATYTLLWSVPLSFVDVVLSGNVKDLSNELTWKLKGETKAIKTLELLRKVNGGSIQTVTKMTMNGDNYAFSDTKIEKASAKYTYYVIAKDAAGEEIQSNLIYLDRVNSTEISIYPNPVTDVFKLLFAVETISETDVVITDQAGKTVYRVSVPANTTNTDIDVVSLAVGVYNVSVTNDALGTKVIQLIKK